MKFGCCLNMVSGKPDGTGMEHLEELASAGFDYVELPLAQMCALDEKAFENLKTRVQNSGVPCEVCNNFFPADMRLTGARTEEKAILEYAQEALARAESLGAEMVVFGSGPAKNVPEGFLVSEGYRQTACLLKKIAPIAKRHHITIVIEPLRKEECNLINSFEEGSRLARDVSEPNVKVLVDFYHMSAEKEPPSNLLRYGKGVLSHVHFAEPEKRRYPIAGQDNYIPFFEALKEIGYDGRISLEAYSDHYGEDASKALELLKRLAHPHIEALTF